MIDTSIADARRHQAELERQARNAYNRAWHRARARSEKPFTHGTADGYGNHRCRCDDCRRAWRDQVRRQRKSRPSPLAVEADRLRAELDAAEMHIDALREENAALRCRLDELEGDE